mgnify:CR=1 FL=1
MKNSTPRELGFHMPAEWEPHEAVWLAWPHDLDSFPHLEKAEAEFAAFIREVRTDEHVNLLVLNQEMRGRAKDLLKNRAVDLNKVSFYLADYADIWMRDYGPIFVLAPTPSFSPLSRGRLRGGLAMTKWIYNALGRKYPELLKDNEIPYMMNQYLKLPMFEPGIVLEGGSIEVNGQGTLITTESCLLNKNRNSNLSKEEIEGYLRDYLGAGKIIWLKEGIEGDDTDGHVDDIARFVNPNTVLCAFCEDRNDPDYKPLKENFEILSASTDQDGKKLKILKLPTPGWVGKGGRRVPASYANFYISNKKVIVPTFGTPNDKKALEIIQSVFAGRKVVGLSARNIVFGLGTFHCMTQQQPASQ